jgi:hypothetical protein
MLMLVLSTCKRYLPNNITKNTSSVTLFLNNTASNLTNKLATDAKLNLANRTPLKLYIWGLFKLLIIY